MPRPVPALITAVGLATAVACGHGAEWVTESFAGSLGPASVPGVVDVSPGLNDHPFSSGAEGVVELRVLQVSPGYSGGGFGRVSILDTQTGDRAGPVQLRPGESVAYAFGTGPKLARVMNYGTDSVSYTIEVTYLR
jgi:hypothetical protein